MATATLATTRPAAAGKVGRRSATHDAAPTTITHGAPLSVEAFQRPGRIPSGCVPRSIRDGLPHPVRRSTSRPRAGIGLL